MLRSRTLRLVLVGVLAVAAVGLLLTFIPSNHYLVLPDRARPTDPLVAAPLVKGPETEHLLALAGL